MRKVMSFIVSAVLTGMLLNAGIALAHSNDHKDRSKKWHHKPRPDAKLLEPRSLPYALPTNAGEVDVTFSVQLINEDDNNPQYVFLREKDDDDCDSRHDYCKDGWGNSEVYKLNDQGQNGDRIAGDNVYSAMVSVDTKSHRGKGHHKGHEECLDYRAFALVGKDKIKSPAFSLCITSFPIGAAESNTSPANLIITDQQASPAVADELLVRFDEDSSDQQVRMSTRAVGAEVVGSILPRNLYQFRFPQALTAAQLAARIQTLERRPGVISAYLNRVGSFASLPNDPEYLGASQHGYELINADNAWEIGADGAGVTLAVLDSGIALHADLSIFTADAINHGTAMAGIAAAATNNGVGIAGVAGSSTLQSFTVSADAGVTMAEMVAGFQTVAASSTAQVVIAGFNTTLAPPGSNLPGVDDQWDLCAAINDVVTNAGTPVAVVVSAAGNNNSDSNHYPSKCNDSTHPSHAGLTNKNLLIAVMGSCSGGSCPTDTRQADSNYGSWIDVAAPAVNIRSTNNAGGYSDFSGTSYAAALVAGTAAQMLSCDIALNQIQSQLVMTGPVSVAFPGGSKSRIDAYGAVTLGINTSPTGISLGGSTSINENIDTSAGHIIGTLSGIDANICDAFTFVIQGGADAAAFSIGGPAMNQLIITDGVLDFETQSSYSVTVRVLDTRSSFFDQTFVININNQPEPPIVNNQAFSITENSANGTAVGNVVATDPDASTVLSYSITGGNTGGAFAINSSTGAITVANSAVLDFETTPSFALTVEVSDSALTDTATITINLTNANEAPVANNQSFSINENSANGTGVGTVSASDPDAATVLSYSITGGNTGGAFAIGAGTGAITVASSAALDFETTPSFALAVEVSDGVLSDTATVTVNLNNVVENTAPVVNNQTFSVNENSANGTIVGTVAASDGEGDSLSFSITGGNTGGAFAIGAGTGTITVANSAALDFETTPSFALTVEVSDGVLTDTATITVNLNNLPDTGIPNPIIGWVLPVPYENYLDAFGNPYIRYRFEVTNRSDYPVEMFEAAPSLPPCGLNTNSSRTWVYIYNGVTNAYIYGFCALGTPDNMGQIWFAIPDGGTPPPSIYITLIDRQTSTVYTSNTLTVP